MKKLSYLHLLLGILPLFYLCISSCNPDAPDEPETPEIILSNWELTLGTGEHIYANDTAWIFVYDTFNQALDKDDTLILGPFKGHPPIGQEYEHFDEDILEDIDDKWVLESLTDEGCMITILGWRNGKIVVLNQFVKKGANCGNTTFDEKLKRKTILSPSYDSDSLYITVINYETGALISERKILNGDFADVEIIDDHLVTITQGDSVHINVEVSTDITTTYGYPGRFISAKENGVDCKIMVIKNGNGYTSYIICPDSPIVHLSPGTTILGDSLADLQTHRFSDTNRYVSGVYDTAADLTKVDVLDNNGVRKGQVNVNGRLKKTSVTCDGTVKTFICEGNGNIYVGAIRLKEGNTLNANPASLAGSLIDVSITANPCGIEIRYQDPNGQTRTQTIDIR